MASYSLVIIYSIFYSSHFNSFCCCTEEQLFGKLHTITKKILLISTSGKLVSCFTVEIYHT